MNPNGKVTVKTVHWFNDEFIDRNCLFYNENKTAFIEFDTKKEAEVWIIQNIKEESVGPLSVLKHPVSENNSLVYRPYLSNQGFITIVSIESGCFEAYDFERFFPSEKVEGSYIEFDSEDKAHSWILEFIDNQYIDPQLRPINLNDYLKPEHRYIANEKTIEEDINDSSTRSQDVSE